MQHIYLLDSTYSIHIIISSISHYYINFMK